MMHKFLKVILTTSCLTIALNPAFGSDDEGESGGVDISSLFGGGNQTQQPKISSYLLQQIPSDPLSDSTDKLKQIFENGGKFSYGWHTGEKILTVGINYDPAAKITPTMESFRSIEESLSGTISTVLQVAFFPEGDNSVESRAQRTRLVTSQTVALKTLSDPKKIDFFKAHPELFGDGGVDQFIQTNLQGAFTAPSTFEEEENALDQALLKKVLESDTTFTFTFAFPRTDGIFSDKKAKQEIGFGNSSINYVAQQNNIGTISVQFSSAAATEKATLGDRRVTSQTGLSDIVTEFESLVMQTLNRFITAATMKSGASSGRPGMYH